MVFVEDTTLFLFTVANLAITVGYLFLALAVVPKVRVHLRRTKIGGMGFFLLCGLTHTDMALHALFGDGAMSIGGWVTSWHMLAIHVPQAICVWMFVTGLYIEVGRWGLLPHDARGAEAEALIDELSYGDETVANYHDGVPHGAPHDAAKPATHDKSEGRTED